MMFYEIVQERSAKIYQLHIKEVASLLEDIKDPPKQARKKLAQILKLNLITGNL